MSVGSYCDVFDHVSLAYQRLEETKDELLQWSPTLRKHVDSLVMELTKRDALQLVYRAEDHAQALNKEADRKSVV